MLVAVVSDTIGSSDCSADWGIMNSKGCRLMHS
jgi:hypothetical protein